MAKKDNMHSCMSEWKDKHPKGRADKKMSKGQAHKQAVAVCLQKTNEDVRGWSLLDYITEMDQDIRAVIRGMPMYQELIKNPQTKPEALKLAKSFLDEFNGQQPTPQVLAYIQDEFDDMYRRTIGRHGSQVGDWEGEAEYKKRDELEKQLGMASDKWEREMGMDAVSGEEIPRDQRGRLKGGARVGLDMRNKVKQKQAAQDLLSFRNYKNDEEKQELERKASMDAPSEHTWDPEYGGPTDQNPTTKVNRAKEIASEVFGEVERGARIPREVAKELKRRLAADLDMGKNGVNTYYYRMKKLFDQGEL